MLVAWTRTWRTDRAVVHEVGVTPEAPEPSLGTDAAPRWAFGALAALAATLAAGTIANRTLDPDESQHLHAAWLVAQGQVPFVDFWEHHTPALYYLLAPVALALPEGPAIYFVARAAMAVAAAGALAALWRLTRRLGVGSAMAAIILLALQPRFVEHATQVRPDVPALTLWATALAGVAAWRERGGAVRLWGAGLALGLAVTFTPKALVGAVGLALVVAFAPREDERRGARWRAVRDGGRLAAGAVIPVAAFLAGLLLHGGAAALRGLVDHVGLLTFRFVDFTKEPPVSEEGVGFLLLLLIGIALTARRHGRATLAHPLHGTLLTPLAITTGVLLLPGTPAVYRHSWLPVLLIGSVYAGVALAAAIERARAGERLAAAAAGVALLGGLVGPASVSIATAVRDGTSEQLRTMRLVLRHACPGEAVLDGTALYVFRPAAYRYRTLIRGVRLWIAQGAIAEEEIVADVRRTRPAVAYADARLRALVGPLESLLARQWVLQADGLLVPGARVPVPGAPTGGRVGVDLLRSGPYRLAASPGIAVAIDRIARAPGVVDLEAGRHELTWTGPPGWIELAALGCAERTTLGRGLG